MNNLQRGLNIADKIYNRPTVDLKDKCIDLQEKVAAFNSKIYYSGAFYSLDYSWWPNIIFIVIVLICIVYTYLAATKKISKIELPKNGDNDPEDVADEFGIK